MCHPSGYPLVSRSFGGRRPPILFVRLLAQDDISLRSTSKSALPMRRSYVCESEGGGRRLLDPLRSVAVAFVFSLLLVRKVLRCAFRFLLHHGNHNWRTRVEAGLKGQIGHRNKFPSPPTISDQRDKVALLIIFSLICKILRSVV